jgi:hypothetical protein
MTYTASAEEMLMIVPLPRRAKVRGGRGDAVKAPTLIATSRSSWP